MKSVDDKNIKNIKKKCWKYCKIRKRRHVTKIEILSARFSKMDIYKCPKWWSARIPCAIKLHVFRFPPTLEEKKKTLSKKVTYKQFFRQKNGSKKDYFRLPLEIVSKFANKMR
jgi:hypothetical protein